jgi:2-keto-3-deoxy-L-rhamnonate aldolase RhmA
MNEHSDIQLGTWLSIGSPVIAELAALSGFDWVLLDLEHGCASEASLPDQLRALKGTSTLGIVRVGAPYPDLIARVLDWGADGIMVPHVESEDVAASIVRAACHAPRGKRGFSRTVRATGYGLGAHPGSPILMAQIETVAGVAAVPAIAAVEGITTLFVGPADLRHDLEYSSSLELSDYDSCLEQILVAAREAGKEAGILVRDPAEVSRHAERGFTRLAVHSDLAILRHAYETLVSQKP